MTIDLLTQVQRDTGAEFRHTSTGADGPEHTGPCPFCQAGDNRGHVWPKHSSGVQVYWCRVCGKRTNAVGYMMELHGMSKTEAVRAVMGDVPSSRDTRSAKTTPKAYQMEPSCEQWQTRARAFVAYAQKELWSEGIGLPYLLGERGLRAETIRHFGLGYCPRPYHDRNVARWGPGAVREIERRKGRCVTCAPGVVIPCEAGGVLWYVKTRCPNVNEDTGARGTLAEYIGYDWQWTDKRTGRVVSPKYHQPIGGTASALFGADDLRGDGRPLLVCEGEFDAMLAWQELREVCDVCAIKVGGRGLPANWLLSLLPYSTILVCYDVDGNGAGDRFAMPWMEQCKRARRVRVPEGSDLTDFYNARGDLRAWLAFQIDAAQARWKEL